MPSYLKNEIILVRHPFSDFTRSKVRPAIVVKAPHVSQDAIIVPLTNKLSPLLAGEFALADWELAGLNVASAAKRGLYTMNQNLIVKSVGKLSASYAHNLGKSLRDWLGLR